MLRSAASSKMRNLLREFRTDPRADVSWGRYGDISPSEPIVTEVGSCNTAEQVRASAVAAPDIVSLLLNAKEIDQL